MGHAISDATSIPAPPAADEAEMCVLGAILLSGTVALPAACEEGLTPEDFWLPHRGLIFQTMISMHADGEGIDRVTLADRLHKDGHMSLGTPLRPKISRADIDLLAGVVPNVGNLRQYARIVVRASMWRDRDRLLTMAQEAVDVQDEDAYRRVLGRLRECELRFRPLLERDLSTP